MSFKEKLPYSEGLHEGRVFYSRGTEAAVSIGAIFVISLSSRIASWETLPFSNCRYRKKKGNEIRMTVIINAVNEQKFASAQLSCVKPLSSRREKQEGHCLSKTANKSPTRISRRSEAEKKKRMT